MSKNNDIYEPNFIDRFPTAQYISFGINIKGFSVDNLKYSGELEIRYL
jgi:hypothetical protein